MSEEKSKFKLLQEALLRLSIIATEDDAWKQYQYTGEQKDVVIDRAENAINHYAQAMQAEIERLQKELDTQKQLVADIWEGKHGCVPHPCEVYKPGIWIIKHIDEHQGHMEWLMSEDELQSLKNNQLPF